MIKQTWLLFTFSLFAFSLQGSEVQPLIIATIKDGKVVIPDNLATAFQSSFSGDPTTLNNGMNILNKLANQSYDDPNTKTELGNAANILKGWSKAENPLKITIEDQPHTFNFSHDKITLINRNNGKITLLEIAGENKAKLRLTTKLRDWGSNITTNATETAKSIPTTFISEFFTSPKGKVSGAAASPSLLLDLATPYLVANLTNNYIFNHQNDRASFSFECAKKLNQSSRLLIGFRPFSNYSFGISPTLMKGVLAAIYGYTSTPLPDVYNKYMLGSNWLHTKGDQYYIGTGILNSLFSNATALAYLSMRPNSFEAQAVDVIGNALFDYATRIYALQRPYLTTTALTSHVGRSLGFPGTKYTFFDALDKQLKVNLAGQMMWDINPFQANNLWSKNVQEDPYQFIFANATGWALCMSGNKIGQYLPKNNLASKTMQRIGDRIPQRLRPYVGAAAAHSIAQGLYYGLNSFSSRFASKPPKGG